MKNTIIKGTGNSRYLKSSIPASTTLEDLIVMLRNGTFPIDILGLNPEGVEQVGTPLDEDSLLKLETAQALNLPQEDPTVNDALAAIASWQGGGTGGGAGGGGSVEIVPWSTGTNEQIAAMVAALDAGTLSVEDTGWAVGDERTVSLAAMAAGCVKDSHEVQDVTFVLGNVGGKFFEDGTECHFVVLQKDNLKRNGQMNTSGTNSGGWEQCARRTWCNDVYSGAIPATLLPIFKRFKNISGAGDGSSGTQETVDLFALAGEGEIFGSQNFAFIDEVRAETQFEWYKTPENRVKIGGDGSAYDWWGRSPRFGESDEFCAVGRAGVAGRCIATYGLGLAPFGCI